MSMFKKETFKVTYCPRTKGGLSMTNHTMVALIEAYTNGEAQMIFRKQYPDYSMLRCDSF